MPKYRSTHVKSGTLNHGTESFPIEGGVVECPPHVAEAHPGFVEIQESTPKGKTTAKDDSTKK